MAFKLKGIYAPIPTPFAGGKIAYDKLDGNLEFWLGSKLEGLVVLGSNGEFVLLSTEEKVKIISYVCEKSQGRKPVIAGTGAESTEETIYLSQKAAEAGAAAVLVVTPNYYKGSMTEKVLKKFYLEVAEASPIPLILYNMPRNTGVNLSAKVVAELAQHPNIIGIKDSGGNIVQIAEMIKSTPSDFSVFAGSASFLYPSLVLGAAGGTLALANVFPDECVKVQELFEAGKHEEAKALQFNLIESNAAVTSRFGIAGLKAAMDMIGYYGGDPRSPLQPLGEAEREELKQILGRTPYLQKAM
ncbi:dihydrodipicolinate synthase/N-acetylneuraminate lyase [Desulfosporosinus orientis DSM 765]|uniref:Dihydrodipicolinate synthase/N-acetylneuraminate lyase n=1 Tax=Desulfosporosinus orientis (strain ATCC 19365 / DSM 765 / NCIMB 8382 / VKM B-1628 / Singapore I) TaxID=768706 RepID=G7WIA3_DESOD|nr:dihydrodipicolinate synthase family protein [Desulfosporosinus orientis]AET68551.1 dihydrodipicolinate synthase/N-acetylneuraminate lyase [Desulfosporosinus orientis DSM 765]